MVGRHWLLGRLAGHGLRERVLRSVGAGRLYDELARMRRLSDQLDQRATMLRETGEALEAELARSAVEIASFRSELATTRERERELAEAASTLGVALEASNAELGRVRDLRECGRLVEIDFPVYPRSRHGWSTPPPHPQMYDMLARHEDRYRALLESFLPLIEAMSRIPSCPAAPGQPHWVNDWFPAFDAISLYGLLATRRPRRFVEVGSGNSTMFARRAIADHSLPTRVVSIDPFPRAEVDAVCDEVLRQPLEAAPLSFWEGVTAEDMVFFDGSHRAFQNSDATVFFTEVLPLLPAGSLVGIHDIFLPSDYPPDWLGRWYSEQYLLVCWLLGGDRLRVELPVFYCSKVPALHDILKPFWDLPGLAKANIAGGCFWFQISRGLESHPHSRGTKN